MEEAVLSAIQIDKTGEVLLIDDASTDNSLSVCRMLELKYSNVRVLTHPENMNLGAAASRNLGITSAKYDFISFLDADDYYMPNRFDKESEIFAQDETIDGVYGCNDAIFENDSAKTKFLSRYESSRTTTKKLIAYNELYYYLLFGGLGRFHTSTITLRKGSFIKSGLFNTQIRYVEDTELWLKLSLKTKLIPGSIDTPISIRRVHDTNSIHQIDKVNEYSKLMYQLLFDWSLKETFTFSVKNSFFIATHQFVYGKSYDVKKLFWEQFRRNKFMIFREFFYKKIFQLYFFN